MKKETRKKEVNTLEILLKKLQEHKPSDVKDNFTVLTYDIVCVKRTINLMEWYSVDDTKGVDLDKYDKISGSEWNETLEKKDGN